MDLHHEGHVWQNHYNSYFKELGMQLIRTVLIYNAKKQSTQETGRKTGLLGIGGRKLEWPRNSFPDQKKRV